MNNKIETQYGMKKDKRSRRYCLTINNPQKEWTHDVIKEKLKKLKLKYWCMSDEIGLQEKTYHTHIYLVSEKSAIYFSRMKTLFPTAHIEPAYSTHIANFEYVTKTGKWLENDKSDTSIEGTFEEFGILPDDIQGKRTDWDMAREMIEDDFVVYDVIDVMPHMISHQTNLERFRQMKIQEQYRDVFRNVNVTYICGKTGLGKTRHVMDKYSYRNVCQITNYKSGCFDKYNCQDVIVFDEFNSNFTIQEMNVYLDGYPLELPCRYQNKIACYTNVYIISNIPLEMQYPTVRNEQRDVWDAFIRRIDNVMIFTGTGEYDLYTTEEYFDLVNIDMLKKKSEEVRKMI